MAIPPGLVEYSTGKLECMARQVFRTRPGVKFSPPIDLEFIIEADEDKVLGVKNGLLHQHKIEGCVLKEEMSRRLHVWVDYQVFCGPWPRYNAVLAEEFSHIHLHMALVHTVKTVEDFIELQQDPQWERFEKDAKKFSRMIRMPAALVADEAADVYPRLVQDNGFGDGPKIFKLLRNHLAQRFEASQEDALRRMLDAACNLEWRVSASVQSASDVLITDDWEVFARLPGEQRSLFAMPDSEAPAPKLPSD